MAKQKAWFFSYRKGKCGARLPPSYNALSDSDRAYTGASVEDWKNVYSVCHCSTENEKELTAGSTIEVISTDEARVISLI